MDQILVHLNLYPVSLLLALEATELLSEPVTQMALKLINNYNRSHFSTAKDIRVKATFFFM